jgi:hypothetical protein
MALQIQGKFISSEAIDGEKLLLSSGQAVRLMSATGEVRLIELDEVEDKVKVNGVAVALSPDLVSEINRAIAAEGVLQTNISAVASDLAQEVIDRQAGDASTLSSANSYTDTKVADLVNSAPAVLDTLKELADALGGDANFATTVAGQIGTVSAAISAEVTRATGAESALQSEINTVEADLAQELLDRAAAVASVQSEVDAVEIALAQEVADRIADVNAEEARAIAAEASLQSQIDTLTGGSGSGSLSLTSLDARLDVIEGSGEGSVVKAEQDAKDYADAAVLVEKTRAEGVEAQLAADISAEETRALAAEALLSGRLDTIEGSGEGSVAKAEADAKAYADQKIADLVNSAPAVLDTLQELAAAINNDASFAATIAGQIGVVAADVAAEEARALAAEGAIAADLATETANRIADVNAEETRALAAESELASDIAQEVIDRAAAIAQLSASVQAAIQSEANARVADVDAEESRALAAESQLAADIAAEEARAEAAEAGLAADILAEETRALAAESALDVRVDVLEARAFYKIRIALVAQDITNGYINLGHVALPNSIVAAVGRLMIHETAKVVGQAIDQYEDDFYVETVGGVSRLVFVGNLVEPGQEKLSAGDVIFVRYMA